MGKARWLAGSTLWPVHTAPVITLFCTLAPANISWDINVGKSLATALTANIGCLPGISIATLPPTDIPDDTLLTSNTSIGDMAGCADMAMGPRCCPTTGATAGARWLGKALAAHAYRQSSPCCTTVQHHQNHIHIRYTLKSKNWPCIVSMVSLTLRSVLIST